MILTKEQMCASRELSQELAKYVKLDTLWYWRIDEYENTVLELSPQISVDVMLAKQKAGKNYKYIPAPNVSELLYILPQEMEGHPLMITKYEKIYAVEYLTACPEGGHYWHNGWMADLDADTPANALCKMANYLYANGLIKGE